MLRSLRHFFRLFYISYVLARHDVLYLIFQMRGCSWIFFPLRIIAIGHIRRSPGECLARALSQLGPTFIKFGQALSTRPDVVGEDIAEGLAALQDKLPAFSFKAVRRAVTEGLGKNLEDVFPRFDPVPVAAASIAQVHFAEDSDGNKVAVKVLRPHIEARFEKDIDLLLWLAERIERRNPESRRLKPVEVVKTFAETSRMELDLRMEAAAAAELKENFKNDKGFKVPEVYWPLTSQRVLTMERVEGTSVYDREKLRKEKHDFDELIAKAGEIFFKQVFRDGFFHADMHPGNLFIDKKGNIVVVDFGIMGRLDVRTRIYLAEMLKGFFERDYAKVSRVHFDAGYVPATESPERFAQACRAIAEPIFGLPQSQISIGRLLALLFKVTRDFNMQTQPQLLLLQKTLVMAEGLGRILNPNVNIWQMASPYIEEWAGDNLGPKAKLKLLAHDLTRVLSQLRKLLGDSEHLSASLTPQGLRLHPASTEEGDKPKEKQGIGKILKTLLLVGAIMALSAGTTLVTLLILARHFS